MPWEIQTSTILASLGFLVGAIPFALVIGKLIFNIDIRSYGDGNPGATNLWKARGFGWAVLAYIFDFSKGAVPVGICFHLCHIQDWWIVPVAVAPIAGHAFSPFLRFRGGKAIATTYGVWAGITIWEAPVFLALSTFLCGALQKVHCWTQVFVMLLFPCYLTAKFLHNQALAYLLIIWLCNFLIIVIRHRREFITPPQPQSWITAIFKRQT